MVHTWDTIFLRLPRRWDNAAICLDIKNSSRIPLQPCYLQDDSQPEQCGVTMHFISAAQEGALSTSANSLIRLNMLLVGVGGMNHLHSS
jgi:hypothetical protein